MIPGAFERQSTLSKRIPRDRERPARSDEVESRKLCVGRRSEGESERWSAERREVKGGWSEVTKDAIGRGWSVDVRMQKDRAEERVWYDVDVV